MKETTDGGGQAGSEALKRRPGALIVFLVGLLCGAIGYGLVELAYHQLPRGANRERTAAPGPLTGPEGVASILAAGQRQWARPVSAPGLPNLFRVSDDLLRGAQPEDEGFAELKKLGIRTVINLRSFHGESEHASDAGLAYEHIFSKTWHFEDEDVVKFLRIVGDAGRGPFFVHCMHGSDRTGTMCAIYRVAIQGWPKEEAIREMTQGGFGFHENFDNLVEYIRKLDVDQVRREAGLEASPATQPGASE